MAALTNREPAVVVSNLTKSFGNGTSPSRAILNDISFDVSPGEVVGLFGPSGCGKSTVIKILCSVLTYDEGDIRLFGKRLGERRGTVAYVPQRAELIPWKTLFDNSLLGWYVMHRQRPDREILDRAHELFERFGLTAVARQYPAQCSGGERQRAALIRALLMPASLLALDEPVAAIDHITRVRIHETLLGVVQDSALTERPMTVVIISHDPEELLLICDRVVVMSQRPSTIVGTVIVPFGRPRDGNLKFDHAFIELKRTLWGLLT